MIRRPACPIEAFNLIQELVKGVENKYDAFKFPNYHNLVAGIGIVMENKLIIKIPEYAQRNMFSRIIINSCIIFHNAQVQL